MCAAVGCVQWGVCAMGVVWVCAMGYMRRCHSLVPDISYRQQTELGKATVTVATRPCKV